MDSWRFFLLLFLLSSVLFGCSSTEDTSSSELPWARPANWDINRPLQQYDSNSSHENASHQFKSR
ncbi:MAG: hypothetical protein K2L13_00120 [Opitutales bacterium]|nr:hypothetical protein [Opitutales bacterium]